MSQYTIFDYRSPDATRNLNEMHRMIIPPGVYHGYLIEPKPGSATISGGLLRLRHEANPDYWTTAGGGIIQALGVDGLNWLSVLKTRDGITCIEAGGTLDSGEGYETFQVGGNEGGTVGMTIPLNSSPTNSRIDYVVAQYDYNQGSPPNNVQYTVLVGIPGNPPLPPSLQRNQVLLAEVLVPPNTTTANYETNIQITNVSKKKLDNDLIDVGDTLVGYLRPGVYYGYDPSITSAPGGLVTLSPGGYFTRDGDFVADPNSNNFDLSSFIPSGAGATIVAIAAINYPGIPTNAPELPDYVTVSGAAGTGEFPTEATIAASPAAQAIDPRVTEDHVTILAFARLTNAVGIVRMQKSERIAVPDELVVTDGIFYKQSSFLVGSGGLRTALSLIWEVNRVTSTPLRYKVIADGLFYIDSPLDIPSNVQLSGWKGLAIFNFPSPTDYMDCAGAVEKNVTLNLSTSVTPQPDLDVPGGFTLYQVTINAAANDYSLKRFVYGDTVLIWTGTSLVEGTFYYRNTAAASNIIQLALPTGVFTPPSVSVTGLLIMKTNTGLSQAMVENGELLASVTNGAVLGLVGATELELGYNRSLLAANLAVYDGLSDIASDVGKFISQLKQQGSRINRVESSSGDVVFGVSNNGAFIGMVELKDLGAAFQLYGVGNRVNHVIGELNLFAQNALVDFVYNPSGVAVRIEGVSSTSVVLKYVGSVDYTNAPGTFNQIGATAKILRGTGLFKGAQVGAIIPLPDELEANSYRVLVTRRDETPTPPDPGTDIGEAPIGEVWSDGGAARARNQFVVKNSGWDDGDGPILVHTVAIGEFTEAGGIYTAVVQLDSPVIPSTVTISGSTNPSGVFSVSDNGSGAFSSATAVGSNTLINYGTGVLTIELLELPNNVQVEYTNGPWPFDWIAIQD